MMQRPQKQAQSITSSVTTQKVLLHRVLYVQIHRPWFIWDNDVYFMKVLTRCSLPKLLEPHYGLLKGTMDSQERFRRQVALGDPKRTTLRCFWNNVKWSRGQDSFMSTLSGIFLKVTTAEYSSISKRANWQARC